MSSEALRKRQAQSPGLRGRMEPPGLTRQGTASSWVTGNMRYRDLHADGPAEQHTQCPNSPSVRACTHTRGDQGEEGVHGCQRPEAQSLPGSREHTDVQTFMAFRSENGTQARCQPESKASW